MRYKKQLGAAVAMLIELRNNPPLYTDKFNAPRCAYCLSYMEIADHLENCLWLKATDILYGLERPAETDS